MNVVVTLTPNPSLDLSYTLAADDHLGRTEIEVHRAVAVTLEASGKGINVTRTQAHGRAAEPSLALTPVAVLPIAGATGAHLVALLAQDGLECTTVAVPGETRINTTTAQPALGSTVKVNSPGPTLSEADAEALLAATATRLQAAGLSLGPVARRGPDDELWLAVCGSFPPGLPPHFVTRLVALAHSHGARVAVDTAGSTLAAALEAGADLLAPNVGELAAVDDAVRLVTGSPGADRGADPGAGAPLVDACAALAAARGCQLLVSRGADGALWTDGTTTLLAAADPVVARNTAGAGDALLAGWLAGGTAGERLSRAVRWGRLTCLAATTVADPTAFTAGATTPVHLERRSH